MGPCSCGMSCCGFGSAGEKGTLRRVLSVSGVCSLSGYVTEQRGTSVTYSTEDRMSSVSLSVSAGMFLFVTMSDSWCWLLSHTILLLILWYSHCCGEGSTL